MEQIHHKLNVIDHGELIMEQILHKKLFRQFDMKIKTFAGCFLSAFIISGVQAAEIFVSPTGNDSNSGSASSPYRSIQRAVDAAQPGDTVKLLPGIYRGSVVISKSGTADKPLKITGSRSPKGDHLSIIEAEGQTCTAWQPAPEIGKSVWKIKMDSRPDLVMLDGKMIAQINGANMRLKRRTPLPEKLNASHIMGDHSRKKSKRLAGLDLLAVKDDIRVTAPVLKKHEVQLWPVLGYVLCGWHGGYLYIRFANGSSPDKHTITALSGDGITLDGASDVVLSDLYIRGSKRQVYIIGKSRRITVENCLLMHGSCRVMIEKDASDITVRSNILTCGFIKDTNFKRRIRNDMSGGLTYLVFKYIIGVAKSDDAGVTFRGKNCDIYDNIIVNGLLGIRAGGPGAKVHGNCIKGMSSCGMVTSSFSSGEFYENLIMDCGIALRIHDWRHERFYRTEYHYRNLFVQPANGGTNLHIYGRSDKLDHDKVNFDKKGIYKANPPSPFDPGKIFIYHNTFSAGGSNVWPIRNYYEKFRKQPMPFYFANNIIKCGRRWDIKHQHMLAGNLLYISPQELQPPMPEDENVGKFNRIVPAAKLLDICVALENSKFPDVRLKENSPAFECAIDISVPGKFNGIDVPALPGFKQGSYTGKAPAAGALQQGDDKLMEHFVSLHRRMLDCTELLKNLR